MEPSGKLRCYNLIMPKRVTIISSLNNSRIKDLVKLNNRRQREARKLTVVEGQREAERALQAGIVPLEVYVCPDLMAQDDGFKKSLASLVEATGIRIFEVTPAVYKKIAYRGESGGVVLVIPYFKTSFSDLSDRGTAFLVVIDGVEKPGNLGAVLRTADAAGVDALILTHEGDTGTDLYNPNVIRASLGAIFTVPVLSVTVDETVRWLKEQNIQIVATSPEGEALYSAVSLTGPVAVVLGSEAAGLGNLWLQSADVRVQIPMFGSVDSLNLSVSTALLLYEVVRQRTGKTDHP